MTVTRARGIDCSEYNNIDWPSVPATWCFAFIRSSSGVGYKDKSLDKHYAAAKATGRLVGPYHYCLMSRDPVEQANYFYQTATAGGTRQWDLPPAADFELPSDIMNHTADDQAAWLDAFCAECTRLFRQTCLIYSFPSAFKDDLSRATNRENLRKYLLWMADLSKGCPPDDSSQPYQPPFMTGWEFWQVSGDTGPRVPGISTAIDQDVYNGTPDQLQAKYGPNAGTFGGAFGAGSALGAAGIATAVAAGLWMAYDKWGARLFGR